jgi:hypothetical protein
MPWYTQLFPERESGLPDSPIPPTDRPGGRGALMHSVARTQPVIHPTHLDPKAA